MSLKTSKSDKLSWKNVNRHLSQDFKTQEVFGVEPARFDSGDVILETFCGGAFFRHYFPAEEVVWMLQEEACGVLVALERGWSATVPAELCSEVALAFGLRTMPATPAA